MQMQGKLNTSIMSTKGSSCKYGGFETFVKYLAFIENGYQFWLSEDSSNHDNSNK